MGHKLSAKGIDRRRRNAERIYQKECERFSELEEITADSEVYDLSEKENWKHFKEQGWRYSPAWKAFFAPPVKKS